MKHGTSRIVFALGVVAAIGAPTWGDPSADPAARFEAVFGQEIREARQTRDTADDVALAQKLIKLSEDVKDDPKLIEQFTLAAFNLTHRVPEAYATAVEAMRVLASASPEAAADCEARSIEVLQLAHARLRGQERTVVGAKLIEAMRASAARAMAAGEIDAAMESLRRAHAIARASDPSAAEAIQQQLKSMSEFARVYREIEATKNRLKADPANKELVLTLVMLYVSKLDQPAEAAKFSFLLEPELQERLKLVNKPIAELDAGQQRSLGEWYASLSDAEQPPFSGTTAARAVAYLEAYIATNPEDRLQRIKTEQQIKQLRERAAQAAGPRPWTEVFSHPDKLDGLVEIGKRRGDSSMKYAGGTLTIGWRMSMEGREAMADVAVECEIELASAPEDGNHFRSVVARRSEAGQYDLALDKSGVLILGRRTLERPEPAPLATKPLELTKGRVRLALVVVGSKLVAQVDGREVLRVEDPNPLPAGKIGVCAHRSMVSFRNLRYRPATSADVSAQ